jgi:hypothetical protein
MGQFKNYSLTGFLGCFIENNESGCNLNDIDLLKSLLSLICKITNDVSLHNSNHLKKFDEGEFIYMSMEDVTVTYLNCVLTMTFF